MLIELQLFFCASTCTGTFVLGLGVYHIVRLRTALAYAVTTCAAACAPFKNSPGTYATCCKQHSATATPVYDPVHHNVYVTNYHSNEAPGNTVSVISTAATPPAPPNTIITSATSGNGNPVLNCGSTVSTSITFQISAVPATNPVAGFECSLDGSAFSACATRSI